MIAALLVLAQVGPSPVPLPTARIDRPAKPRPAPAPFVSQATSKLAECLAVAQSDPTSAIDIADAWTLTVKGSPRADPLQCRGAALAKLGRWSEAEAAFVEARDALPASDRLRVARLGAMAGDAALGATAPERALPLLDAAHASAMAASDARSAGEIARLRAEALVALNRPADAASALAEARTANPTDAVAWLLSATLSRRAGKLADAQSQIEEAARLLPIDPDIGLEAGVIAVLSGREAAARRSWQSVVAAAPDSPAAATAESYLAQLGPATPTP